MKAVAWVVCISSVRSSRTCQFQPNTMSFLSLLSKLASQGVLVFVTGLVPLYTTSRQSLLASLTMIGTGRLVFDGITTFFWSIFFGAAASALSSSLSEVDALGVAPAAIAIIHVAGVLAMFVAERRLCSRMLRTGPSGGPTIAAQDDHELREWEQTNGSVAPASSASSKTWLGLGALGPHQRRVYLFVFAFVVEEIANGISVGYAALAPPWKPDFGPDDHTTISLSSEKLYLVSLFGKGATTLGFVTTLLAASLPIAQCKRHVLLYVAVRPLAALLSYTVTMLSGAVPTEDRPYIVAMNSFTGGMLVYAGLVVRALIVDSRATARSGLLARVFFMAAGALLPHMLPILVSIGYLWYAGKLASSTTEVV